jgi:DNA-binding response OmpR family regulator
MGKTPHSAASVPSLIYHIMTDNELLQAGGLAGAPMLHPTHLSPPRILVVDEDSDLRLLYTEALVRPGYQVDAAEDGAAALKALRINNYNLLITEHSLPTLTGVELVRTLRAARLALPVIMAVARFPIRELDQNPALQPVAVLPKPFYISQLLETVKVVLRAAVSPRGQNAPPQKWENQPSVDSLQLG